MENYPHFWLFDDTESSRFDDTELRYDWTWIEAQITGLTGLTGSYNDPVPNEFDTSDIYANDEVDHAKELVFGKGKGNANDEVDHAKELVFGKGKGKILRVHMGFRGICRGPVPEEVDISEMKKAYDNIYGADLANEVLFGMRTGVEPMEQALNCPKCNSTITKYCHPFLTFSQQGYFCNTCGINYRSGCRVLGSIPDGGGSKMSKVLPPSTSTHHHENSPGADENAHMILDYNCQRMRLSLLRDLTLGEVILDMKENKGKEAKDPSSSGGYSGGEDLLGEFPSCPRGPFTRNFKFDNSRNSCADERIHDMMKDGVGLSQSSPPTELPQDIRIDIPVDVENRTVSSLDCTGQERDKSGERIDSQVKVAEVVLAITGQGAFALMDSPSSPVLSFIKAAIAVGFVSTLIAILFRERKPLAARIAGKVGAVTAAVGIIGVMGLGLPEKFLWTTGLACLIPTMAVVFA